MPTYVYRCDQGHEQEDVVPVDLRDYPPHSCKVCLEQQGRLVVAKRVPAVSAASAGFPGAASWRGGN